MYFVTSSSRLPAANYQTCKDEDGKIWNEARGSKGG
jgi:hypothetical protein